MQVYDVQQLQAKFAERVAKVDAYFQHRTNLILNQTVLKLGEYNLSAVPALLGMNEVKLLAVLTASEVALFSRFTSVVSTLILVFDNPESKSAARFHIRVQLESILPIADRKNVCWLQLSLKSAPAELVEILGTFWEEQAIRLETYQKLGSTVINMDETESTLLGYLGSAELVLGTQRWPVRLQTLSTQRATVEPSIANEIPPEHTELHLKLAFKTTQVSIPASLASDGAFVLEFSQEFLTVIEDYVFRKTMLERRGTGVAP